MYVHRLHVHLMGAERIRFLSLGFSTFFIKTSSQSGCWLGSKSMMDGAQTSEPLFRVFRYAQVSDRFYHQCNGLYFYFILEFFMDNRTCYWSWLV
jgi:hypothetical protein